MASHHMIFGPPGTGKTEAGMTLTKDWFERDAGPEDVAYLAFTKAAAREAVGRILQEDMISDKAIAEKTPFFRTIHSLCYMGMRQARGANIRVLTVSDMKHFKERTGFEGSYGIHDWEDLAEVFQKMQDKGRTHWDQALAAYTLTRITAASPAALQASRTRMSPEANMSIGYLEEHVYKVFVEKYERFKSMEGVVDFTDMLEWGLLRMTPLEQVKHVVIDEAQDLCPLHHAIMDRLFERAQDMWWIGDDDQAIYRFAGASAELFLSRAKPGVSQFQLRDTHRFGQGIVDFSGRIIRRVSVRKEKEIRGVKGRHGIPVSVGSFKPRSGNLLLLHRHVKGCQALGQAYIDAGIPFTNERGKDPLSSRNRVKAWKALDALASGRETAWGNVRLLLEDTMPSMVAKQDGSGKTRLLVHGAKTKLQNMTGAPPRLVDLMDAKLLTEDGKKVIEGRDYPTLKHSDDFTYYERVTRNGYNVDSRTNVPAITTIHGSKGRQAGEVVVFSEMGRKCWQDRETEHRLAYVAVTRTQGDIQICAERSVDWAVDRYDYPIKAEVAHA